MTISTQEHQSTKAPKHQSTKAPKHQSTKMEKIINYLSENNYEYIHRQTQDTDNILHIPELEITILQNNLKHGFVVDVSGFYGPTYITYRDHNLLTEHTHPEDTITTLKNLTTLLLIKNKYTKKYHTTWGTKLHLNAPTLKIANTYPKLNELTVYATKHTIHIIGQPNPYSITQPDSLTRLHAYIISRLERDTAYSKTKH